MGKARHMWYRYARKIVPWSVLMCVVGGTPLPALCVPPRKGLMWKVVDIAYFLLVLATGDIDAPNLVVHLGLAWASLALWGAFIGALLATCCTLVRMLYSERKTGRR